MALRNLDFTWMILLFIIVTVLQLTSFTNVKEDSEGIITGRRNVSWCHSRELKFEKIRHGDYCVLKNLIVGEKSRSIGCAESITYATNGDYRFVQNVEAIVVRWLAPISFALYAPGYDLISTLDAIQYARNCLPDSQLIVDFVSFHIYFPRVHMPNYIPFDGNDALRWPMDCFKYHLPYETSFKNMYRLQANLSYPINVGRNIARMAVNTHFILTCDIELVPSVGFVDQFLNMVKHRDSESTAKAFEARRVYALPVFEVIIGNKLPQDRSELVTGVRAKRIRLFHERICLSCHNVPQIFSWLYKTNDFQNKLRVFSKTHRVKRFQHWEPVYVSDNTEPFFDERVNWEGQYSKRLQAFAMCLLGYEYHVLYPAFLVHLSSFNLAHQDPERKFHARDMQRLINLKLQPEYRVLYGINTMCLL